MYDRYLQRNVTFVTFYLFFVGEKKQLFVVFCSVFKGKTLLFNSILTKLYFFGSLFIEAKISDFRKKYKEYMYLLSIKLSINNKITW
jgi:hypothetical protein